MRFRTFAVGAWLWEMDETGVIIPVGGTTWEDGPMDFLASSDPDQIVSYRSYRLKPDILSFWSLDSFMEYSSVPTIVPDNNEDGKEDEKGIPFLLQNTLEDDNTVIVHQILYRVKFVCPPDNIVKKAFCKRPDSEDIVPWGTLTSSKLNIYPDMTILDERTISCVKEYNGGDSPFSGITCSSCGGPALPFPETVFKNLLATF